MSRNDVQKAANKNARVIIPAAIVIWLLGIVVFREGAPAVVQGVYIVAFAIGVPFMVFYLMAETGWRALAKSYREIAPFAGSWKPCATGQMALVSVHHPDFQRMKMRFVGGSLRVGTTADALYLSTLFSRLPVLRWFFPILQIPWSAVSKAHAFDAPGWFRPASEPGSLLQVAYDPNYTGKFIEMEIGEPPVFLQLSEEILGEAVSRLLRP